MPTSAQPPRRTLVDLFHAFSDLRSECIQFDNGSRTWRSTWRELGAAARNFAGRLLRAGLRPGDKVLFWSENRPEWIAAFWGCVLCGIVIVPLDYRSSPTLLRRVQTITGARLLLTGEDVRLADEPFPVPVWPLEEMEEMDWTPAPPPPVHVPAPDDIAEIVFTSGATGDPRGVVLTHRNILANLASLDDIVRRYGVWFRPLAPLRFLALIPLSHMFGQMLTLFFLPLVPASAVLMRGASPHEILRQIRLRRVSVVIAVPRLLEVLREALLRRFPELVGQPPSTAHPVIRWWRFRRVHRLLGLRFWAFAIGAAPLDFELERFWAGLGIAIIQGYGLTETSPIIAFNNPFDLTPGTVGKPIAGLALQIASDGEILVRGENVTPGYYHAPEETAAAFAGGWFHTGDLGSLDDHGNLTIHGRKKELIVTSEGLNVIPEDVEQVLERQPGVREAAVVGRDHVHAVLVLSPGASAEEVLRCANRQLEDHQKIRQVSVWPEAALPRTEGTGKLRRAAIQNWVDGQRAPLPTAVSQAGLRATPIDLLRRYAPGRVVTPQTTLDELALSSIDRVSLLMELEQQFDLSLDESLLTDETTAGELERLPSAAPASAPLQNWSRAWPARLVRRAGLTLLWLPLTRWFAPATVAGLEHLAPLRGPVIFAANHQSHLDTPAILAALPRRLRFHIAVAMWKEYFDAHFNPGQYPPATRWTNSLLYALVTLFFNTFPIPQTEGGARQSLRYLGERVGEGWSILYFPEGERTEAGEIRAFQPGIGLIASRLRVPVVPVRLRGLEQVLHRRWKWPRRGPVSITFGPPLRYRGDDFAAFAANLRQTIEGLGSR